jgi:excinuclease ABC subunit B
VKGDTVDVFLAYADYAVRIYFWGDEIESIQRIDPTSGKKISDETVLTIFPANLFVTGKATLHQAIGKFKMIWSLKWGCLKPNCDTLRQNV